MLPLFACRFLSAHLLQQPLSATIKDQKQGKL